MLFSENTNLFNQGSRMLQTDSRQRGLLWQYRALH